MVNHAYTLLNNDRASAEYQDPGFRPVALPPALASARAALVPADPAARARALSRYLTLVHATELAAFLTDVDPRLAYPPEGPA